MFSMECEIGDPGLRPLMFPCRSHGPRGGCCGWLRGRNERRGLGSGGRCRGQEAAAPQLGDLQREIVHLGAQGAGPVTVAVIDPLFRAPMQLDTEHGSGLQLDELLQAEAGQLGNQLPSGAANRGVGLGGGSGICLGNGSSG